MQSIAWFDLYGHDLTTLARERVFSCESETFLTTVERLFQILTRPHKNSAILLDWDEEARWQVVASLVHRLAHGQAPAPLCSWRVIALDYEKLNADLSNTELTTIQHRQVTPLERRFQAYCTTLLQSQERSYSWSKTSLTCSGQILQPIPLMQPLCWSRSWCAIASNCWQPPPVNDTAASLNALRRYRDASRKSTCPPSALTLHQAEAVTTDSQRQALSGKGKRPVLVFSLPLLTAREAPAYGVRENRPAHIPVV